MKKLFLELTDGRRLAVTGEAGKYWLCGEERFRKLGNLVSRVEEVAEEEPKKNGEAHEEAPAPKKKAKTKKKTEAVQDGERGE